MINTKIEQLIGNSWFQIAVTITSLLLSIFITFYFLVFLKTAVVYTHLFYIPVVLTSAWWGKKGVVLTFSIVTFLLLINFYFAPNISLIDNFERSLILLFVSTLTCIIYIRKKRTENKLEVLKTFNEKVINSIGDCLLVIDPKNFRIISTNEAALKQLNYTNDSLIGKTCYEATHHRTTPCTSPNDICPIQEMLKTGNPVVVEHQHFDSQKRKIDVEVSVHPIKDKNGQIIQAVHINRDITARKNQERDIKGKADEVSNIVNGIGDLLFVIDKNRIIIRVNKSTCDFFKKTPEELIGKYCYEIVHGTSIPWFECPATKTFETKNTVTEEVNDPNVGIPLLITTSPILDEQGEVAQVVHVAKDITKMKLAEMELFLAASFFDAASDSILVHDLEGRIVYFNEAAHKLRGYTRDEFQGLKVKDLEASGNLWDFNSRMKELQKTVEGTFETYNLLKDHTIAPFEIHAQIIEFDGKKLVLSVARDVSERKKIEEKLKESSNRIEMMNEKLRVVGSLTRHDVRNKLSAVTGYAYLLKKKHSDQSDIVDGLSKMEQSIRETTRIFDFAKLYEQIGVEELTYINVEEKLNEALALFSVLLPKIKNECGDLIVLADSFLRQLFYNFIDNTIKYGKKTSSIRVYFEKTEKDELNLIYEDDGIGISATNKVMLFKEGFSTGQSTGYGLFLIKRMMDVYGWSIQETGQPDKGAKFVITIPKLNKNGKDNYQIK